MLLSIAAPAPGPPSRYSPRLIAAVFIVAFILGACSLLVWDALGRRGWPYFSRLDHWSGALGLFAAAGTVFGGVGLGLFAIETHLTRVLAKSRRQARALALCLYGGFGGLFSVAPAIETFSGEKAKASGLSILGPLLLAGACALGAGLGAALFRRGARSIQEKHSGWILVALAFFAAAVGLSGVDLTQYVSLYPGIHQILELFAILCGSASFALILLRLAQIAALRSTMLGLGAIASLWVLACCSLPSIREWLDQSLKHVWLEEVYVGRMLRRGQIVEAFLRNPFEWRGVHHARLGRLHQRYPIRDRTLAPQWEEPLSEPLEVQDGLRQLRAGQNRYNVLVYYVDTLRADVASDPATMPALARFRRQALDFRRAYATGSDTLRSLPALTGGDYDVLSTGPNDVLRVAKRVGYDTVLVTAKSAFEFVAGLRPEFRFDQNLVVEDYSADQQVWGYGANRATAGDLVTRALDYLDSPRKRPFFLWLFNFDQHNWRELDSETIQRNAARFGIADDPSLLAYRYRVVARMIDHQFGRLLSALEQRSILEDTILLFVSDHGEALGRDGFWVHSVFLWESLVRVPLILRVPGLGAATIDQKVSLVDLAPTIGRYLDPALDGRGFHGQDLLQYLLAEVPPRRHPLLLLSASKDVLVRVGLLDPSQEFKLVVAFESGLPELYDLTLPDPDATSFAGRERERVRRSIGELFRSPVFPRAAEDFEVRDTKEQKRAVASSAALQ